MKFNHPVVYGGEVVAYVQSEAEARKYVAAMMHPDGLKELEVVPPPPPSPFVGESGIPIELFERGDSLLSLPDGRERIEIKDPDQFAALRRTHEVLETLSSSGKTFAIARRKE